MKKYVAVYMAPHEALDQLMKTTTPEQSKQMMDSWNAWIETHKASFIDVGSPLGKNMRVSKDGISPARNDINGYSVVQAESLEEAAKIFQDNPQLQMSGSYIDVLEWVEMKQ